VVCNRVTLLACVRPLSPPPTVVARPPLGRVSAETHSSPVQVDVRLDQLDVDRLQALFQADEPDRQAEAEVRHDLVPLLRRLLLWALVVGLAAGAVAGAVLPHRRWSFVAAGALGGLLAVAALSAVTWRTYDTTAFEQPEFGGPLEWAPSVIQAVRRHVDGIADVQNRVDALTAQVADLYTATTDVDGDDLGDTVILHVSDIHSNPLGMEIAGRLARGFGVDAIVDTGDLTSFGLPLESRIGDQIARLGVPYYFVPGNHDSAAHRAALAAVPNVTLLDGDIAAIGQVRVLGVADPTFTATNEVTTDAANLEKVALAGSVARSVWVDRPDLLAVHDIRMSTASRGLVPVVVAGQTHKRSVRTDAGTLELVVGSTGATGIESFLVEERRAYEAELLRFSGRRLVAIDYVSLRGVEGAFRIDRRVVAPGESVARPPSSRVQPQ
ncbi:MAG: metallophosphoesterase family protein, partial [Acidimicrobiales bacterium]